MNKKLEINQTVYFVDYNNNIKQGIVEMLYIKKDCVDSIIEQAKLLVYNTHDGGYSSKKVDIINIFETEKEAKEELLFRLQNRFSEYFKDFLYELDNIINYKYKTSEKALEIIKKCKEFKKDINTVNGE
jgi:hypothetical protein